MAHGKIKHTSFKKKKSKGGEIRLFLFIKIANIFYLHYTITDESEEFYGKYQIKQ